MLVDLLTTAALHVHPDHHASRSERREPVVHDWSTLTATAYCSTGRRNAAGNWPTEGTVAANGYPLGTRLEVDGYGVFTVEDRSASGATELDFFMGSGVECQTRAVAFGRRQVNVREAA